MVRILAHSYAAYYSWTLKGEITPTACMCLSIGYFIYNVLTLSLLTSQVLDCVDGKQARKTGSSSPLGLLFDHGADAINCILITISVPGMMQMGPAWGFVLFHFTLTFGFFFATLEQYYVGSLNLPIINGVSDGSMIMIGIEALTAFTGIWRKKSNIH